MEESELTKKIAELSPSAAAFNRLCELAALLRSPGGCPWDRAQTPQTLRETLIEETFEAVDAICEHNSAHVQEELGDVFFNLVLIARCYEEQNEFDASRSLNEVCAKLVRRHPHVFAGAETERSIGTVSEEKNQWEQIKEHLEGRAASSALASVPKGFPPLLKAYKMLKKAAETGFDWRSAGQAREKVLEELREMQEADCDSLEEEVGDFLLASVNLSRKLGVNPCIALENAVQKFKKRFLSVEKNMKKSGLEMKCENDKAMLAFWNEAKNIENKADF